MSIASYIGKFIGTVVAEYDSLNSTMTRERRTPHIEPGTQEEWSLTPYNRLQAIANGRDLHQNYAPVKSILRSFKTHIYGTGPQLHLKTDDPAFNTEASEWFNNRFARKEYCDGAQRRTLNDMNKLSLISRFREGDIVCWFDAVGALEEGRAGCLYWFEADRITSFSDALWKRFLNGELLTNPADYGADPDAIEQVQGVIRHKGSKRHIAYIISSKYGLYNITEKDAFSILPATMATIIVHDFRISDTRGTSDLLSSQADFEDGREIKQSLKMRVKNQAGLAMVVKCLGSVKKAITRRSSTTQPDVDSADAAATAYSNLEKIYGGRVEYIGRDDDVHAFQLAGDSKDVLDLLDRNDAWSSAGLGLPDQYSRMQADASYSAARAITNMASEEFEVIQSAEEDYVLDWQARQAITWAIQNGKISTPAPADWQYQMEWLRWPVPKAIDPVKDAQAKTMLLKTAQLNYADIHGPNWEAFFDQREKEKQAALQRGLKIDQVYGPIPQSTVR